MAGNCASVCFKVDITNGEDNRVLVFYDYAVSRNLDRPFDDICGRMPYDDLDDFLFCYAQLPESDL